MKSKRKDVPLMHKIVTIISIVVSLSIIVLGILQIFKIWVYAINVCIPLMGAVNLCQAYLQWSTSRKVAYFCIGTSIFIFICAIVVFCIK